MAKSIITALPLGEADRALFIKRANEAFEYVLARMEPDNPETTRSLWDAEAYIDNLLGDDMLPVEREYALSLVQPFLVSHVASLAGQADALAGSSVH